MLAVTRLQKGRLPTSRRQPDGRAEDPSPRRLLGMTGDFADKSDIHGVPVEALDDIVIGLPGDGLRTTCPEEDPSSSKWGVVKQNPRAIFWSQFKPSSSCRTRDPFCSRGLQWADAEINRLLYTIHLRPLGLRWPRGEHRGGNSPIPPRFRRFL